MTSPLTARPRAEPVGPKPPRRRRDLMPDVTSFVQALSDAFGADNIEAMIARGQAGEPTFYAKENGIEIGSRIHEATSWHCDAQALRDRRGCASCDGTCIAKHTPCPSPL
jgi:hypothetical protein